MGKERNGSDDKVDGGEGVGNSIKRAPLGRSDTEATTGKPWEIAWGEFRCEGVRRKRRQEGRMGNAYLDVHLL